MTKRRLRFLAFGCPHVPLHDIEATEWLLKRIEHHRPDVIVCLGDLFEADSASRWPSEYDWTLTDEFREVNSFLARIRRARPGARYIFLPGNHDDNLLALGRLPRKVRLQCSWNVRQYDEAGTWLNEELLTYWERPAKYIYCRRRGVWRLGQVTFAHGYERGINADEFHAYLLGYPNGLYVGAHSHHPQKVTQTWRTQTIPLPYWYANVGCLRNLKPHWVFRQRTHLWGHGLVVGEVRPGPYLRNRREWFAETEIFHMYDDWSIAHEQAGNRNVAHRL